MLENLVQINNCKETRDSCQYNAGDDQAIQGINRQQNVIFSFNGFDGKAMLKQGSYQQGEANPDEDHAGNMSRCFSHLGVYLRKSLLQTAENLVNRNAGTNQAQTVANPGINRAFCSRTIPFLRQFIGSAKQFLGLRIIH